ncbi:MAG: YkvA family protein [Actinomycetota bacterium]|nr:YkvA family protein [Actinomycetota bacterium]
MGWEAWKRRARQLSAQTYALYLAYRHPRTPWYAKVFAVLVVGYVFSPIDPIPDFIPGVGLLDEMVVVPIGVLIAAKMIPRQVMKECQEKAREVAEGEKPVSRVAAVVVVAVWLLCVALAVLLAVRVF